MRGSNALIVGTTTRDGDERVDGNSPAMSGATEVAECARLGKRGTPLPAEERVPHLVNLAGALPTERTLGHRVARLLLRVLTCPAQADETPRSCLS